MRPSPTLQLRITSGIRSCSTDLKSWGTLYILQQVFFLSSFYLLFFSLTYALFHASISQRDYTPLQLFYKDCTQSNQQLSPSSLMYSIHCGSSVFPFQVLERRPAQDFKRRFIGRAHTCTQTRKRSCTCTHAYI
jgi:hypothetical protein